uniref:Uncharacterized protein n=1 Tax=uncultured bacterium esnapd2 TaxID=1366601 RepID=S5TTP0_9BACT|nr:hypothetical protein [uncultured bacterium esnapd2]
MTGSFQSLYYTDCLPGQGLRGGAGFQFQAVSPGVSHETMTLVQRSALYEPPVAWMREQRPVSEYPASLTHVFDGSYVTARGIYLGTEANGTREGNQFTHAIATSQVDSYGMVRPAQLWDAAWWSEKPAASTECPAVDAEPEPGPWGVDRVREWVLGQPDAEEWLIAIRSAFERLSTKGKRRILFVSADAAAVLGWIAAGTLLLPQEQAIRVGFRVFAMNPHQSQHDVLALHPDWAGSYANTSRNAEFVVFDLATGKRSEIEPTEAARHWVPQFLRADPFDVVDAVELTHQFAQGRAEQPADRLAASIILSGRELTGPAEAGQLATWLAGQSLLSGEDVLEPLVEAALAVGPDLATLRELDATVLRMAQGTRLAARVGLELLRAELDAIAAGRGALPAEALTVHPWSDEDRRLAAQLVERAANTVAPQYMDLVLRTASRFNVRPLISQFTPGANRFVQWWSEHPTPALDPNRWPEGQHLVDLLKDRLRQQFDNRPSTADAVRQHWWKLLRSSASDPHDPLDGTVIAAALEHGGPEELTMFLGAVPGPLPETLAKASFDVLEKALRTTVSVRDLDLLAHVVARVGPPPKASRLQTLVNHDRELTAWIAGIRVGSAPPRDKPLAVSEQVFAARGPELEDLLLRASIVVAKLAVDQGGRYLHELLARKLPARLDEPELGNAAVALTFVVAMSEKCAAEIVRRLDRVIDKWVQQVDEDRKTAVRSILATLEPVYLEVWDDSRGAKPASEPKQAKRGWFNRRKDNEEA